MKEYTYFCLSPSHFNYVPFSHLDLTAITSGHIKRQNLTPHTKRNDPFPYKKFKKIISFKPHRLTTTTILKNQAVLNN